MALAGLRGSIAARGSATYWSGRSDRQALGYGSAVSLARRRIRLFNQTSGYRNFYDPTVFET
jgi:hypothetical protein